MGLLCGFGSFSYANPGNLPTAGARCEHYPIALVIARILDALLPRHCLLCGWRASASLCDGCAADLPVITGACPRCGIPLVFPWEGHARNTGAPRLCGQCVRNPPAFDATIAALDYVVPVTVLVQRFKFNRSFACGLALADQLIRAVAREVEQAEPHTRAGALVPVPLHRARCFLRGFNQAEVLAHDLGKALGIPVMPGLLRRTRRTPAQAGLTAAERARNLRGAFLAPDAGVGSAIPGHVAVVDDVMTTGATVSECARALKRAGARTVSVWVAARAR